jgi:hypothetical protein
VVGLTTYFLLIFFSEKYIDCQRYKEIVFVFEEIQRDLKKPREIEREKVRERERKEGSRPPLLFKREKK